MYYNLKVTKELEADVVVIGGGTAGVFAAVSAARCGAKTILVEKNSRLGGTMTAGGVNYPGLFFAWGKQIIDGPCWEAVKRTVELGGAVLPKISFHPEHHWEEQITLDPLVYTTVLFRMCAEAGVHLITDAMVSCATEGEGEVHTVVTCKDGMISIHSLAAIDATGDATLCQLLGFDIMRSPIQQPATLQNHISGYEMNERIAKDVRKSFDSAELPSNITADDLIHYLWRNKLNVHIPCVDADTAEGRTRLEKTALYTNMQIICFLKKINGLENLVMDRMAQETGVRETCRVVGRHIVTEDEYISGYTYPDSVCYAFYPIDLHVSVGIKQRFHEENVVSKIPYRALIPQNARRVFCVGRCVSSDTNANSALRVEAPCMAMGQAAGAAAAVMLSEGCDAADITYQKLCSALESIGAIVPKQA